MITKSSKFLVFDVESIGLHGEAFAVAGLVVDRKFSLIEEFCYSCDPKLAKGTQDDRTWIEKNVPPIEVTHSNPQDIREAFWKLWLEYKEIPGLLMAAECLWPVEGRFLNSCIADSPVARSWQGPYPLIEIASILEAAHMDCMVEYSREENELPKHHPLSDARQSARLLTTALNKLYL